MKSTFIRGAYLVVISIILFSSCNSPNSKKKRIIGHAKVNPNIINLGKVKYHEMSKGKFKIINLGKTNLIIQEVPTTCHCTVVSYNQKPIPKNDTSIIELTYDNSNLGYFQKSAIIYTNSDNSPFLITIRGEVIK